MLYNLIILPIETVVDWVFSFFISKFSSFGIIGAVFGVSLIINFLALPLYNIADSLQEKERKITKKLEPRVKKIKKTFKGNEQFLILSTYYRQNDYHPLYVLRSSLSILIEIPFFIAAYHYLSNCEMLKGSSFWIFNDLGSPDDFFKIGNFTIHILPILMTLINFISGAIYTKEAPFREKIQLYIVALLFLVLLYNSPSGLVIYWILNNIFSLIKNIVMKMNNPGKILHRVISGILVLTIIYFIIDRGAAWKIAALTLFSSIIILFPFVNKKLQSKASSNNSPEKTVPSVINLSILIFSGFGLALLCGFLLPSSVISTSPIEFSFLGSTESPLTYVWSTFTVFLGFFVFWPLVIYFMFGNKTKKWESLIFSITFLTALLNAYVFKCNYSNLNSLFELENHLSLVLSSTVYIISLGFFILIAIAMYLLDKSKVNKFIPYIFISLCVAEIGLGTVKYVSIKNNYKIISANVKSYRNAPVVQKEYNLSKEGKNVVVIFLDRGISGYIPKIFQEYPEIKKQYDGFTYYPNTISFSDFTVTGTPPLYGGYEYTQQNMNARKDMKLRDKHNEALLVMPKLFNEAGYEATMTDPSWPNYHGKGDLEFCKKYPELKISEIAGKYYSAYKYEKGIENLPIDELCKKGCIDFSILQCLFPFVRITFYDSARRTPGKKFKGDTFLQQLANLYYLPEMTGLTSEKNTFTFIENETTHEVAVTLNDDLETVSNTEEENQTFMTYQVNAASLKQIGKWFDYLRINEVYDNTRVIIVSDHGENRGVKVDVPYNPPIVDYNAILLVKDFNSNEPVKEDMKFMTTGDVIFLAKENLSVSNVNPFTGNQFVQEKENGVSIYHCTDLNPEHYRNINQFELNKNNAWHVSENVLDINNWIPLEDWEKTEGVSK